MIEIAIRDDQIAMAQSMSQDLGILRNSITNGGGNIAGFLGEIVLAEKFGFDHTNSYDYDLITSDGKSVDVKTKRTNYPPLPYYDCSIAAYNTKQQCDYYCFSRVHNDFSRMWFLGIIEKERYFEMSRLLRKGERDGDNGFIVKADCFNLRIDELWGETLRIVG